jgi:hypothetical protein
MPQSDLSSFIPLSLLFIFTFFMPILVESSFMESDTPEFISDLTAVNIRKSATIN